MPKATYQCPCETPAAFSCYEVVADQGVAHARQVDIWDAASCLWVAEEAFEELRYMERVEVRPRAVHMLPRHLGRIVVRRLEAEFRGTWGSRSCARRLLGRWKLRSRRCVLVCQGVLARIWRCRTCTSCAFGATTSLRHGCWCVRTARGAWLS